MMWPRRKMMYHTLGTIYALVAILTGTSIVIYSCVPTRRTVFARIRFTVVDIWKREINGGKFTICTRTSVYISEVKFSCEKRNELPTSFLSHCVSSLREAIQGHAYSQLLIPENKDKCWTWQAFHRKPRLFMQNVGFVFGKKVNTF